MSARQTGVVIVDTAMHHALPVFWQRLTFGCDNLRVCAVTWISPDALRGYLITLSCDEAQSRWFQGGIHHGECTA
jgi:hypothetical protein